MSTLDRLTGFYTWNIDVMLTYTKENIFYTTTCVMMRQATLEKDMSGMKRGIVLKNIYLDLRSPTPVFEALDIHNRHVCLQPLLGFEAAAVSPFRMLDELKSFFQRGHSLHDRYYMHRLTHT